MSEICFTDYVYPRSCGTKRWEIVNILMDAFKEYNNEESTFRCYSGDITFETDLTSGYVSNCSVLLGHEVSTYARVVRFNSFTIGPAYNHSYALVTPVQDSPHDSMNSNGWAFVNPFTLPVWSLILGVISFAFIIQFLMRKYQLGVSTSSLNERNPETLSRSILSATGSVKLYASESRVLIRELMSCCMAIFSVFIMSLYSSNLINFFYYQSLSNPITTSSSDFVVIHPAYKNIISYEDLGVYKGSHQELTSIFMIPYGIYSPDVIPVIPNTWGGTLENSTTSLSVVGYYKSAYQILYTKLVTPSVISYINKYVNERLNEYNTIYTVSSDINLNENQLAPSNQLTLKNTWGIFVILGIGYVLSLIFRIVWTKKTGLDKLVFFKREDELAEFMPTDNSSIRDNSSIKNKENSGDKKSANKNSMDKSPGFMEISIN
ncbi:ligand-gated ion channel [Paramecium bursaria Chlorella virus CvsA1]|nr:ligand-gated ion channel [Paramecium bursaria Chlorella virus CviKI]AGE52442.1 ligand-gated ion channel [Paramecium bursaria Chlorella virus CvsA1]